MVSGREESERKEVSAEEDAVDVFESMALAAAE